MPTSHTELPIRDWYVLSCLMDLRGLASGTFALLLASGACSSPERRAQSDTAAPRVDTTASSHDGALADTLAAVCPTAGRRGSVLVARVAPEEEETGITFKLLGDGVGPGVVLCRDVLYADATALLGLMDEEGTIAERQGRAVIDTSPTQIPAYRHDGALYVAVAPFARHRRALFVPSSDQPMDATVWPRTTLLHLKASGMTRGAAYQAAVREGLLPH
jgi:hypothetical protein